MTDERKVLSEKQVAEWEATTETHYMKSRVPPFSRQPMRVMPAEFLALCHTIREAWRELAEIKGRRCGNCRFPELIEHSPRMLCMRTMTYRYPTELCEHWAAQPKEKGERE